MDAAEAEMAEHKPQVSNVRNSPFAIRTCSPDFAGLIEYVFDIFSYVFRTFWFPFADWLTIPVCVCLCKNAVTESIRRDSRILQIYECGHHKSLD